MMFGFYHAVARSVIVMLCHLNIGLYVSHFVNVTVVYHRKVQEKLDMLNA